MSSSFVEQVFGGKLETSYRCQTCHAVSVHRETFTDLNLPVPDAKVSTQELVDGYFAEERLEDDNQYHCDRCNGLQDAVKTVRVLEGPANLMCTLMR